MQYLDPIDLARLSKLSLRVRRIVEGTLAGQHASPVRGHSREFAQHREYSPGDELRRIDWRVFGRSDRFFVKQYQDETNLRAYLLVDASGSMAYAGEKRLTKLTYAVHLAAAIAYVLLHQGDAVGLGVFDTDIRSYCAPQHPMTHLTRLFDEFDRIVPGGETAIERVVRSFGRYVRGRGLVILASDLLDEPKDVLGALKYFKARHHDVLVLQVLDPDEIRFSFDGERRFRALEGTEDLQADCGEIAAAYRREFAQFLQAYRSGFRQADIGHHIITTDTPFEAALGRCLDTK